MPSLKHLSFIMLVVQNTALGIVSKYSRLVKGPKYQPGTAILMVEMLKFLLCFLVVWKVKGGKMGAAVRALRVEVFADVEGIKKMTVLAALYAMQNIVALFAYDYVDVATYQIVYQLKIITTAMFMIVLLNRRFSAVQWCAMIALMIGVAVCSYSRLPSPSANAVKKEKASDSARFIGVSIVFGLAINSGLAAAYFERVMKSHKSNASAQTIDPLWVRNLQLSAVSVVWTLMNVMRNMPEIWTNGLFYGFHAMAWGVVFLQAVGGLTIAAVVRYSDNVVKNFGTSFSLIFSCIISNYMFDESATFMFYIGVILVVVAVFVYGDQRFAVKTDKSKTKSVHLDSKDHQVSIEMKPTGETKQRSQVGSAHRTPRANASGSAV